MKITRNVSLDTITLDRIKDLKAIMGAGSLSEVIGRSVEIACEKYGISIKSTTELDKRQLDIFKK